MNAAAGITLKTEAKRSLGERSRQPDLWRFIAQFCAMTHACATQNVAVEVGRASRQAASSSNSTCHQRAGLVAIGRTTPGCPDSAGNQIDSMKTTLLISSLSAIGFVAAGCASMQEKTATKAEQTKASPARETSTSHAPVGYTDTPMLPGGKWRVHDPNRPQPRVVTPGATVGDPPSDAIVLFDGKDLSNWRDASGNPSGWVVKDGALVVPPKGTAHGGDIFTKEEFGDCQLHVEFATPSPPKGHSQERGNSGVFLLGEYEFQVLDSYNNRTYADGGAASLYGQYPPLVNASRPPGEWQVYDIVFTAPHFKEGGEVETPASITGFHNGVLVHNHTAYLGPTGHKIDPKYTSTRTRGPIKLQDHGNPTKYRNIWIRPLKGYDEP